jgi:hypothetical protein
MQQLRRPCNIDRFATESNTVCQRYNSYLPEPNSEAVDGMAQFWGHPSDVNWINPPFHMMADVVLKALKEKAKCIIVAPVWRSQLWFQVLERNCIAMCPVPKEAILSGQGMALAEPLRNPAWTIRAFKLG